MRFQPKIASTRSTADQNLEDWKHELDPDHLQFRWFRFYQFRSQHQLQKPLFPYSGPAEKAFSDKNCFGHVEKGIINSWPVP